MIEEDGDLIDHIGGWILAPFALLLIGVMMLIRPKGILQQDLPPKTRKST